MDKRLFVFALLLSSPLQGSGANLFESGLIFHHGDQCATQTADCNTDSEGNGACIHWVAPYTPSAFRVHASAAADGSKYWVVIAFGVDNGYASLDYNYSVPYSAWREVRLDPEFSACQLYAHFPIIHKYFLTHSEAGAATDYNPGELKTSATVSLIRFGGTELAGQQMQDVARAYCELPYGCHPDDTGCSRYCVPADETDLKILEWYLSTNELWELPSSNLFTLEHFDDLLVEHSHASQVTSGSCEGLPLFEIDLSLKASSAGWPGQSGIDGGEALACFGAYGNLSNFNWAKCPGWDGGPNDPVPPGGSGIKVMGSATQAGIDTPEGPRVVSVPVRQMWLEGNVSGWEIVDPDTDCDGVIDELDSCPATPPTSAVNEFGCSALQFIDLMCRAKDCEQHHGRYMSCVADVVKVLVDQGLVFKNEKGSYMRNAAKCK